MNTKIALPLLVAAAAGLAGCGSGAGSDSKSLSGNNGGSTGSGSTTQGTFTQVGALATGRVAHSATFIPTTNKVLVAGGMAKAGTAQVVLDSAEIFDPLTGTFTPTQGRLAGARVSGQNGRMSHAALALPTGKVVIFGGQTDVAGNSALNSLEVFDGASTSAQFGTVTGNLTEAKADPIVFAYQNAGVTEIAIAGGRRGSGAGATPLKSVNFYRGDSNSILSQTANMSLARFGGAAMPMSTAAGAEVVIAGGVGRANGSTVNTVAGFEVYNPATRSFKATSAAAPSSTNSQNFANRHGFGAALLGGVPAIMGGLSQVSGTTATLDTIEFYNDTTNSWTAVTARLQTPRTGHTVTQFTDGTVIVIGGTASNGQVLASAEAVSGSGISATVTQLGGILRTPRTGHSATLIKIGSSEAILIVGGIDAAGTPVAAAEIYAPTAVTVPVPTTPIGTVAPAITQLTPTTGPIGTVVTVRGTGFSTTAGNNVVRFGGIVTPVQSVIAGEIRVLVPQGAPASSDVSVMVSNLSSNTQVFTVTNGSGTSTSTSTSTSTGGVQFNGPPRIFILLPSSGPGFMPVGIGGTNFDRGTVPYINSVPSLAIFNFSVRNIPLLGSISVGFTIVPPAAPSGSGDVMVEYNGQQSNRFPFTVN